MTPNAATKGQSFKGVIAYITHDENRADTSERVLFTETHNLRTDDPEKAAKVMAWTATHAAELKALAGLKATGRKTENPVYHFSLSWVPGENPSQEEMSTAGQQALKALGYEDHETVFAAHGDKAHLHLHVVVNRIHPETGKTHNPKDDYRLLQRWAHEYDKARGMEHHSPERAAFHERDPALKAEYQRAAQAQRQETGGKLSKERPQWQAEKDATHPKSRLYQEIKAEIGEKVKALSEESRETSLRHRNEWETLQARHESECASLREKQILRDKTAAAFEKAGPALPSLSWKAYQVARGHIARQERDALKVLGVKQRASHAPLLKAFEADQRRKRGEFMKARGQRSAWIAKNLKTVANTKVSAQGKDHRNHLAAGFNEKATSPKEKADFLAAQKAKRGAFLRYIEQKNRPEIERVKAHFAAERETLKRRCESGRQRAQAAQRKTATQQERNALSQAQKGERAQLRTRQTEERTALQSKWAGLNRERAATWGHYRAHRAQQAKAHGHSASKEAGQAQGRPTDSFLIAAKRAGVSRSTSAELSRQTPTKDRGRGRERSR